MNRTAMTRKGIGIGVRLLPVAVVIGILVIAWFFVHGIGTSNVANPETGETGAPADASIVVLTDGKLQAGRLDTETVERRPLQHVHTVPGRIRYDEAKHIEIKSPIAGIITECFVKPGDQVREGQRLAVISSPEIGKARADVLKHEAELALVLRRADWRKQVGKNLQELFADLDSGTSVDVIGERFSQKPLGEYREKLLSALSKLMLANQLSESAKPLAEEGILATRTLRERESQRQIAQAAFRSMRDQISFESRQEQDAILIDVADAERRLKIARRHLETLLGYSEDKILSDASAELSRLEIRAPFAGTIESRTFARSERVSSSDSMFVLADTTTLYVAADIRENDWPAMALRPGQQVTVSAPAIAATTFPATVHYVGREVDEESNSVPLVAKIDNRNGVLRPGMFVRVALPIGKPHDAVAVRPQAVMQHEDEQFVFVAMNDRTFQRVGVVTGLATEQWVEVLSGLHPGQRVVDNGAFLLKSELLLEGEEE